MYRLALLVTGASALLAPAQVKQAPTKLSADLTSIPGASIECGDEVWDPLELAQWRDINELRATELANGRAAMLASVGWVWPQLFGLWKGGPVTTTDPIEALQQVPTVAWVQFVVFCGAIEANRVNYDKGLERDSSKPFFDPLGLYPEDAEGQLKMQLRELKNARTAMIFFAALFVNHFMPGSVPGLSGLH